MWSRPTCARLSPSSAYKPSPASRASGLGVPARSFRSGGSKCSAAPCGFAARPSVAPDAAVRTMPCVRWRVCSDTRGVRGPARATPCGEPLVESPAGVTPLAKSPERDLWPPSPLKGISGNPSFLSRGNTLLAKSPERDLWLPSPLKGISGNPSSLKGAWVPARSLRGKSGAKAKSPQRDPWLPSPLKGISGNPTSLKGVWLAVRLQVPSKGPPRLRPSPLEGTSARQVP